MTDDKSTFQIARAYRYPNVDGGLEKHLHVTTVSIPPLKPGQILITTAAVSLNPADYKVPEFPLIGPRLWPKSIAPCMDFAGTISAMHTSVTSLKVGDRIFGRLDVLASPLVTGGLSTLIVANATDVAPLAASVSMVDGAAVGTVGLTLMQALEPYVKSGDRVFINGGSGGTGSVGVQVAKGLGCTVTTSCSSGNVALCKELGADEVLDYKASPLLEQLKVKGRVFDHVVDNIGSDASLYKNAHLFMKPGARWVQVGGSPKEMFVIGFAGHIPSFLGGGKQPYTMLLCKNNAEDLKKIGEWLGEGKIKPVIDSTFAFEDAPKAFEKLKTWRAKGKIVVKVGEED
jgi:alkaline phosphatase D